MGKHRLGLKVMSAVAAVSLLVAGFQPARVLYAADGPKGSAEQTCHAKITQTEKLKNGLKVVHITTDTGEEFRVATHQVKKANGRKKLTFWIIENDQQMKAVEGASLVGGNLVGPSKTVGGIPGGSTMTGNNNQVSVYINHDTAALWVLGTGVAAAICTLAAAAFPAAVWLFGLCAFVFGVSALVIAYWDSAGAPGFTIKANASSVWVVP